jgi:hypothetical protein
MTTETPGPDPEPPDGHSYRFITLYEDTFLFYMHAVRFYRALLEDDAAAIVSDPDLKELLAEEERQRLAIFHELDRATRVSAYLERLKENNDGSWGYDLVSPTHELIRYLKGAGLIYLNRLKQRRNQLATKPNISRHALKAVDEQISRCETKLQAGVFAKATPLTPLVDQILDHPTQQKPIESVSTPLAQVQRPRPVVLDSIPFLDGTLRARCLDLLATFREDGQTERLDTVVVEATRILEDRLRSLSGAKPECTGVDLATFALGTDSPRLKISDVPAEQAAAHLLYRGAFGFIRNSVHHRLMTQLSPERTLQILGLIDYLLGVAEGAQKQQ